MAQTQTNPSAATPQGSQLGSRETVLKAIRSALRVLAPKPMSHTSHHDWHNGNADVTEKAAPVFQSTLPILGQEKPREWLPDAGESWDDWVQLFAANSQDLRTEFVRCASRAELKTQLERLKTQNNWTRVGVHDAELVNFAAQSLGLPIVSTDGPYDKHELEKCEAGITVCEALVAQTGSLLMTNRTCGGRVLSILPPHHVVIATRDQLLPDLPAAFALLQDKFGSNYPSLMGFITGPSRTGDIERILVLGAHGPKKLTVLLLDE
jgi:L-lactate dehydrogenase complex protein LldG